ncbi:hypothetical protein PC123_g9158 [Phytophthora cactorum]|nr:hypothetical protein PC120_g9155 [Phytophthora cactorum]KAG4055772.1 hypothetical protein PC123_g9158 [Phytophthora cactorum]
MQRAARGLDIPQGTAGQEAAAMKCFREFLALGNMNEDSNATIAKTLSAPEASPSQNFYSLLTAFSIFLQTKPSARGSLLAKATAVGYMSQVVNLLRERHPAHLSDSKRVGKIRDKMGAAIEEQNLLAGHQTGEAPGCTINDLRALVQETAIKDAGSGYKSLHDAAVLTLMWHTFGRAIDTCFARKNQLSMASSGELFLHIARIKTSVVQGISIYKAATHGEQCMLHALGMLFVGASEPSSYAFLLVPHAATSDLPGEQTYSQEEANLYWERLEEKDNEVGEPPAKRVRPNVSKYINDLITLVSDRLTNVSAPLPPELTLRTHRSLLALWISCVRKRVTAARDSVDLHYRSLAAWLSVRNRIMSFWIKSSSA